MFRPDWVMTTCGNRKMRGPGRADQFYTGGFVRGQGEVARALNPKRGRLVFSSKYGLLSPSFIIPATYDNRWGDAGTIEKEHLRRQVRDHQFLPGEVVLALGGESYVAKLREVLPEEVTVLWAAKILKKRGIGFQQQLHKRLIALGGVPDVWLQSARYNLLT